MITKLNGRDLLAIAEPEGVPNAPRLRPPVMHELQLPYPQLPNFEAGVFPTVTSALSVSELPPSEPLQPPTSVNAQPEKTRRGPPAGSSAQSSLLSLILYRITHPVLASTNCYFVYRFPWTAASPESVNVLLRGLPDP